MLPDGGQDGPRSATDVMPAFARGHLGEADGSMSSSSSSPHPPPPPTPSAVQLAPLLNPPGVGGEGNMLSTCSLYVGAENTTPEADRDTVCLCC